MRGILAYSNIFSLSACSGLWSASLNPIAPDERLNADLKHEIGSKVQIRMKEKSKEAASKHMGEQNPERVHSYSRDPRVAYAA